MHKIYLDTSVISALFDERNPETTWEQLRETMSPFTPSQLESPDAPSVYQGKPLSLEEMDRVISIEAGKRK